MQGSIYDISLLTVDHAYACELSANTIYSQMQSLCPHTKDPSLMITGTNFYAHILKEHLTLTTKDHRLALAFYALSFKHPE